MSPVAKVLACMAIALPMAALAAAGYYWLSEPQQLKRACIGATWAHLVAPSTAKMVDFKIEAESARSLLDAQFAADIAKAQASLVALAAQDADQERQSKTMEEKFKKTLAVYKAHPERDPEAELGAGLKILSDIANLRVKLMISKLAADEQLKKLQQDRAAHVAKGLGEVVLWFDSENRASAMLLMQSLCTYHPDQSPKTEATSVQFVAAAESGKLLASER